MEKEYIFTYSRGRGKEKKTWTETYRRMNEAEMRALPKGARVDFLTRQGEVKQVTVKSIKTWKTRRDIRLGVQFGLYEHSYALWTESDNHYSGEILLVKLGESNE